jgi:hypothetical protein
VNDEAWLNDDAADDYQPNGFGGRNGVLVTSSSS